MNIDTSKMQDVKTMTRAELEENILKYREVSVQALQTVLEGVKTVALMSIENEQLRAHAEEGDRYLLAITQALGMEATEKLINDNKDAYDNFAREAKLGKVPTILRKQS